MATVRAKPSGRSAGPAGRRPPGGATARDERPPGGATARARRRDAGTPERGSVAWNLLAWDNPATWVDHGDEWQFHAEACGQPYAAWKRSVVARFVEPHLDPSVHLLELGPGHGRWSEFMVDRVASLTLVDLSPTCIEQCRARFAGCRGPVRFLVNDGRSLPVDDRSVDVVWSFAALVHVVEADVDAYLAHTRRVLRPGGRFVLHHAGWRDRALPLAPLLGGLGRPGRGVLHCVAQGVVRHGRDRAPMSAERFATLAGRHGLVVDEQVRTWGDAGQFGLAARDVVTVGSAP